MAFTELQRILITAGIGDAESFTAASELAGGFGLFIRSLVGLDRAAAKEAFADFLDEKRYSRNQIEFVNVIIDYLTEHGVVEPGRVYESPFTAVAPEGPGGSVWLGRRRTNIRSHRWVHASGGVGAASGGPAEREWPNNHDEIAVPGRS